MKYKIGIALIVVLIAAIRVDAQDTASATSFQPLFNGKDLTGWAGDARFWRVEDGVVIGETAADNAAEHNTFLIHEGEEFGDFELRFSYQVTGFNSGVQYRSVAMDDYVVKGYQADFEARWHEDGKRDKFSGMFFEEGGRMFMGQRGEAVIVRPAVGDEKANIEKIATLGDPEELESVIDREGWNDYIVIAKGFQFTHIINGRVVAIGWDEDPKNRRASGIFALQLHSGPPMQIKIKDMKVRKL